MAPIGRHPMAIAPSRMRGSEAASAASKPPQQRKHSMRPAAPASDPQHTQTALRGVATSTSHCGRHGRNTAGATAGGAAAVGTTRPSAARRQAAKYARAKSAARADTVEICASLPAVGRHTPGVNHSFHGLLRSGVAFPNCAVHTSRRSLSAREEHRRPPRNRQRSPSAPSY